MGRQKANVAQLEALSNEIYGARRIRSGYGGAIRAPRKSMPRRIPAPFRDFSVKTAIPFYLWPNARSVGTESDTERLFSMRLTPTFGRSSSHTGDNSRDPYYARSLRSEDRPCRCKAMLHFFEVVRARPRSLATILHPDRSTTYWALEIDQRERSEGVTLRSAREIVGIVHRKLIH